jgi:replicative DNA helicase
MAKINRESFSYLGVDFQLRLVAQLLVDNKFAESIIEIISPNYFEDQHLKLIVSTIKDAYNEYNIIPDMGSLEFRILGNVVNEMDQKFAIAQLRKVQEANLNDSLVVQEQSMRFCKQQELKRSITEIQSIIDKGDISKYEECEEILKKAMDHGNNKDDGLDVFDNIELVLADDFRNPIPTGISGLDEVMDGGLSKTELAVILAPFGVGKTTMMTKIANTAKNLGYNVLQIFFEDLPKVIQRKHLACWSGYELNELSEHKEELLKLVEDKNNEKGILKLKKFPSDGTTIPMIRQYIRKKIAQGFRPDIILLDYIDCVQPSVKVDDVNVGEGRVMRQFETLLYEFDMAGWTAVQGNRSSLKAEVVDSEMMGGSIKKGQIGHFIVSIAKTLDQKEARTATMAILKSRFAGDGMIFSDIKFDNGRIQIDMNVEKNMQTQGEYKKNKEKEEALHVSNMLESMQRRKRLISSGDTTDTIV